ncbi:60S ribosomal protein L31-like [Sturnira hondurensis]|uniref:60S ribosomal protein L31-like n=1 Tax=Sturnira hondurensis TaxID=192404 RepID=UPI00187966A4|nr:60S ribosomal protein L31-like [Sturnira hondurensis]
MAPAETGGRKKGHSATSKAATREYTTNIHNIHILGPLAFKKCAPQVLRGIRNSAVKETGTAGVHTSTRLHKALRAKGPRNVPYRVPGQLSRKRNEGEDSPNKLYTLVTYMPVTTFRNPQTVNVDENSLLIVKKSYKTTKKKGRDPSNHRALQGLWRGWC